MKTSSSSAMRLLASLLIAGAVLWMLFAGFGVEPDELLASLLSLEPSVWLCALGLHACIYLLRAWRFSTLTPLELRPSFGRLLAASSAHNLAAYVLPMKSGEATFILYSSGVGEVPARASVASLLVSRLLDLFVLCMILCVATWSAPLLLAGGMSEEMSQLSPAQLGGKVSNLWVVGSVFAVVGLFAGFVCLRRAGIVTAIAGVLRLIRLQESAFGAKCLGVAERLGGALEEAGAHGGLMRASLLSLAQWLFIFVFYASLFKSFGWPADESVLMPAVLAAGFGTLANLLPVNGFAGFGTQEGGWVLGLSFWAVEPELALAIGVGAHLVQLGNIILFGVLGHLAMASFSSPKER